MKPLIGVVGRSDKNENDTSLFYIFEDLRRCIYDLGGEVLLLLPPTPIDYNKTQYKDYKEFTKEEEKSILKWLNMCDGIIIPGGNKITNLDNYVLDYSIKNDIPTLGICLGMQIMSCYHEEINIIPIGENNLNHRQETITGLCHEVSINKDSKLYEIIKNKSIKVNSFHKKQATPNTYYKVVAYSEDGIIEAMEYPDKTFNIGVQWHPEKNYKEDENSKLILESFIETCKEKNTVKN